MLLISLLIGLSTFATPENMAKEFSTTLENLCYYSSFNRNTCQFEEPIPADHALKKMDFFITGNTPASDGKVATLLKAEHFLRDKIAPTFVLIEEFTFDSSHQLVTEIRHFTDFIQRLSSFSKLEIQYQRNKILSKKYYDLQSVANWTEYAYDSQDRILFEREYFKRSTDSPLSLIRSISYSYEDSSIKQVHEAMQSYGENQILIHKRIRTYEAYDTSVFHQEIPIPQNDSIISLQQMYTPATIPKEALPIVVFESNHQTYRMILEQLWDHHDRIIFQTRFQYNSMGYKSKEEYLAGEQTLVRYFEYDYNDQAGLTEYRYFEADGTLLSRFIRNRQGIWVMYGLDDRSNILY